MTQSYDLYDLCSPKKGPSHLLQTCLKRDGVRAPVAANDDGSQSKLRKRAYIYGTKTSLFVPLLRPSAAPPPIDRQFDCQINEAVPLSSQPNPTRHSIGGAGKSSDKKQSPLGPPDRGRPGVFAVRWPVCRI